MADEATPTPDELRQLLRYEPETGGLYWKERDQRQRQLGRYTTLAEAAEVRRRAEKLEGYHPNHGRN